MKTAWTATALILTATAAAAAEPTPTATPARVVITGGVDLVQIDTVVTEKGRHVTDLKAEDFEIYEDGRQQRVTNCEYIVAQDPPTATRPTAPPPGTPLRREDVKRSMAIVIDDLSLAFEDVHTLRGGLRKFVDELGPNDLVAVVRTSGGMGILQQFTTDKDILRAAVGQIRANAASVAGMTPGESASALNIGEDAIPRDPEDRTGTMMRSIEGFRHDALMVGTLGALEYVIEGLRLMPGRKSVMLFSSALSIADYTSGDSQAGSEKRGRLRRIADLANRASVVLYTSDPRGVAVVHVGTDAMGRVVSGVAAHMRNRMETQTGHVMLAKETGGIFYQNSNDLAWVAREVAKHQQGYYLVGYIPEEVKKSPDGFHRIEVKVKRRGLVVRSRAAYQGSLDADVAPAPGAGDSMISAAVSPFAPSEVALKLTPVLLRDAKDGYVVRSFLHIDGKNINFDAPGPSGTRTARVQLLTAAFGDNGVVVDQVSSEIPLRIPTRYVDKLKEAGLIIDINLPVRKAGLYQIRAVVRDPVTGKQGSARQFLPVPSRKKDRLALSGIVLKGLQDVASPLDEDPNASHAVRRFKPGSDLVFGFLVYEAKSKDDKKPAVETTLRLYRDNQLVSTSKADTVVSPPPPPPPAPRPVKGRKAVEPPKEPEGQSLLGSFHLSSSIEPGDYVVEVSALDPQAKPPHNVAAQRVGFEVIAADKTEAP